MKGTVERRPVIEAGRASHRAGTTGLSARTQEIPPSTRPTAASKAGRVGRGVVGEKLTAQGKLGVGGVDTEIGRCVSVTEKPPG